MKTVTSSEFRRTFARLTEPVTVTVLGRPIATYTPIMAPEAKEARTERTVAAFDRDMGRAVALASPRPAPKPTRAKR